MSVNLEGLSKRAPRECTASELRRRLAALVEMGDDGIDPHFYQQSDEELFADYEWVAR